MDRLVDRATGRVFTALYKHTNLVKWVLKKEANY
jgi:hypothetical protein